MARVAVKASLTGDKEMLRKLERVAGDKGMRKEARAALTEVAGPMLEQMKARTPVKTGALQRSERIRVMVSSKKEDLRISLLAGGGPENVRYAPRVHETHKTKSKFMESVILEHRPTLASELASKIDLKRAAGA
jgi:HK97 gp10 family phage protein